MECVLSNDDPHDGEFTWCSQDPGSSNTFCVDCVFRYKVKVQVSPGIWEETSEHRCSDRVHHHVLLQVQVPGGRWRCSSMPGRVVPNGELTGHAKTPEIK